MSGRQPIDIQEAFDGLTRAHYRRQEAFQAVAGLLLVRTELADRGDLDALADLLESLAEQAGRQEVAITQGEAVPNHQLMTLAGAVRNAGKGPSSPFSVIAGGKSGEDN